MTKIITRRRNFGDKRYWLTSVSSKSDYNGEWSNCLYLHFCKEDFPMIKSPDLIENDSPFMRSMKKRFEYENSVLNKLEFHGGITFYEETYHHEHEKNYVKVGCDYMHLYDDEYRLDDNGEILLKYDGEQLAKEFEELVMDLKKEGAE